MLGWMSATAHGAKRVSEYSGAYDGGATGATSGLIAGTRVATAMGWRLVEALAEGDLVLTFDNGLQPITKMRRNTVWNGAGMCPERFWSLDVPAGALGNRDALRLMPNQYVMVESDAGEDLYGDPFSLIKANALDGVNGIGAVPPSHGAEAIVLHFETEQVIFAESGVLFYCPAACGFLDQMMDIRVDAPYRALNNEDAEVLVWCIETERATGRIWSQSPPAASAFAAA